MKKLFAFSKIYDNVTNVLFTECRICVAYNPIIQKGIPHPKIKTFNAIWDTGASHSVITQRVINDLSLKSTGKVKVNTAGGSVITDTYSVNIILPNNVAFSALCVTKGVITDTDVLIGMDIISQGDFLISIKENKTLFSFQIPPTHSLDFEEEINEIESCETKNVRNDPSH